jgi:hypothetical protein
MITHSISAFGLGGRLALEVIDALVLEARGSLLARRGVSHWPLQVSEGVLDPCLLGQAGG